MIYYFEFAPSDATVKTFERALALANASAIAYFVSEPGPNTYPALPVRENEHALVWFSRAIDAAAKMTTRKRSPIA